MPINDKGDGMVSIAITPLNNDDDVELRSGMHVTFQGLNYVVTNSANKKEKLNLLTNVTACILPGEMTALMGPSGSGKTTLLDVLAGRKTIGEVQGSILYSGREPSLNFLRRYTGYVEQFDTLLANLTVHEMIMYTCELKSPISEPLASKKARAAELIAALALEDCQHVVVGSPLARGISGGQAKRTNIGIALVTKPRVLFLDEPTSGLDSYTANEVMAVVKRLVSKGITICATIHSPSPTTFALFDKMMILLHGRTVYYGDSGRGAISYFEDNFPQDVAQLGHAATGNAAEWIVDITTKADRAKRYDEFAAVYDKSELKRDCEGLVAKLGAEAHQVSKTTLSQLATKSATATPSWWGLKTYFKYRTTKNFRDSEYLAPRIADKLLVSLIMLTLYWGRGDDNTPESVNNITAITFMWCILPGFAATSYVPAIVLERPVFVRERSDGLYRVITYLLAKTCEELTVALAISLIFSAAVFFAVQMNGQWVVWWLVYFVSTACGIMLAYGIAAMSPNMDAANAAVPAYVTTLLFFVGLLCRRDDLPDYWGWYWNIDFLSFAWGALMINHFEGTNIPIFNGIETLRFYDLDGRNKWAYLGYEVLFFFGFFGLAWLALTYKRHAKR